MPEAYSPEGRKQTANPSPVRGVDPGEAGVDQFMAAISGVESGGNYNARNSRTGASGKFQIMPANWPAWSREALGPGTHAQTPENQEKVARYKMLQYYRQFGSWEAVAVAWFAGPGRAQQYVNGDMSVLNISDGNITVGEYVRRAQVGMGKAGDTIGGTTSGSGYPTGGAGAPPGLPPNASPEQIETYIRENYPQMSGYLNVPEVRNVLIQAARENWTPSKLQAEIQATNWWRTTASDARQYELLRNTDPAEAEAMLQRKIDELEPEIARLGIEVDSRSIAENALRNGWTQDQLKENLVGHLRHTSTSEGLKEGSTVDLTADTLMQMARNDYFVPINRQDAEKWAIDIYAGTQTEDSFRSYLGRLATGRFGDVLESGLTPGDYMAPVRNIIADTLELQPSDVDLLDPRWAEVLEYEDGSGKFRPMTLAEASRWARSRPEFRYTQGADAAASSLAEMIGTRFGAVA